MSGATYRWIVVALALAAGAARAQQGEALDLTPFFAEATPFGDAWRRSEQGDTDGALAILRGLVTAGPARGDDVDAHGALHRWRSAVALTASLTEDPGERLAAFGQLEKASEWAGWVLPELARAAEASGDGERAIGLYRRVPLGAPSGVDARLAAARLLQRRGRYDEALGLLDAAGPRGRLARIDVLDKAGRRGDAVAELQALWADASTAASEAELAERLARLGARPLDPDRYTKALTLEGRRDLRGLKRRFPKAGRAVTLGEGLAQLDADHVPRALTLLAKATACPTSYCRGVALDRLGHARLSQGDRTAALQAFVSLGRDLPDHPDAPAALARAVDLARQLGDAGVVQELSRRLGARAASPEQEWAVAFATYRAGDYAAAARLFRRLASRHRRLVHLGGTTWSDRGSYWEARALELSGDVAGAADRYEAVALESPLTWYSHLAWGRLKGLDADRAARVRPHRELERVDPPPVADLASLGLEDGPDVRLAAALVRTGLHAQARKDLEARARLGTLSPGGVALLLGLRVRLTEGDPAGALRRWGWALPRHPDGPDERLWRLMYPLVWWSTATAVASHEAVDPFLALAVTRHESRYNPKARSGAGAHGLMQLLVGTARELAAGAPPIEGVELPERITAKALHRPEVNLRLGIRYLRQLSRTFDGNVAAVLASYNAGPGRVRRWLREAAAQGITRTDEWVETLPIKQAHAYVKAVAGSYGAYRYVYGPRTDPAMRELPLPELLPR